MQRTFLINMNMEFKIEYLLVLVIALVIFIDFIVKKKKRNSTSKEVKGLDVKKSNQENKNIPNIIKALVFSVIILIIFIAYHLIYNTTIGAKNPVYLDDNGVTIKAHKWAKVGDEGIINGVLYTIVDLQEIYNMYQGDNSWILTKEKKEESSLIASRVCTTFITDMSWIFHEYDTFNQDISAWDVSNVTNMEGMFKAATSFNQDISAWDVSKVIDMDKMFSEATSFNQDISSWNVSNVTRCRNFNDKNLEEVNAPIFTGCVSE